MGSYPGPPGPFLRPLFYKNVAQGLGPWAPLFGPSAPLIGALRIYAFSPYPDVNYYSHSYNYYTHSYNIKII